MNNIKFEEKRLLIFVLSGILSFMIFFPVVVATSVFKVLNEEQSSKFLRIFFPKYYLFGLVWSVIGIVVSFLESNNIYLLSFIFLLLTFLFSGQFLTPIINRAKDEKKEAKFKKLHKFSVLINFVQMILCIILLIYLLK